MDDVRVFGPVVYELSLADAAARGLLARYQVVVVELVDPVVTPKRLYGDERWEERLRGQRLAAVQTALLEAMAEHDLKTTITFHHRTVEAQAFAEGHPWPPTPRPCATAATSSSPASCPRSTTS
ncbi:hypothetical protein [Streptomyces sp. NBC_00503]|uniref:hypothetical protein n=1 Tax=Streptomyces sp. NBC_00503 TaxID=2903659 RepID=UPI003FCCD6A2